MQGLLEKIVIRSATLINNSITSSPVENRTFPNKKRQPLKSDCLFLSRAESRTWTGDLRITNALLYQLSYFGNTQYNMLNYWYLQFNSVIFLILCNFWFKCWFKQMWINKLVNYLYLNIIPYKGIRYVFEFHHLISSNSYLIPM